MSEPLTIKHRIPQGTVLGPVLFTLYIKDFFNINIDGTIISYADDTAVPHNNMLLGKI